MTYKNGWIAGRLLSPLAGRGTVRGLGHFAPRSDRAEFVLNNQIADSARPHRIGVDKRLHARINAVQPHHQMPRAGNRDELLGLMREFE